MMPPTPLDVDGWVCLFNLADFLRGGPHSKMIRSGKWSRFDLVSFVFLFCLFCFVIGRLKGGVRRNGIKRLIAERNISSFAKLPTSSLSTSNRCHQLDEVGGDRRQGNRNFCRRFFSLNDKTRSITALTFSLSSLSSANLVISDWIQCSRWRPLRSCLCSANISFLFHEFSFYFCENSLNGMVSCNQLSNYILTVLYTFVAFFLQVESSNIFRYFFKINLILKSVRVKLMAKSSRKISWVACFLK